MKRINQSNNKTIKQFFLASLVSVCAAVQAFATWTYDSSAKSLTDGNWTFTKVAVGAVNGVTGIKLTSQTVVTVTDATTLDFTGGATQSGTETVYPIVACEKNQIFLSNTTITQFIAPDMTSVSSQMFQSCTALKKVVLSPNFASGSSNVFLGCTALDDFSPMEFPKITGTIGNYFFDGCSALSGTLSLPNATMIGEGQLRNTGFTEIYAPKAKVTGKRAMFGLKNITKITIAGISSSACEAAIQTANTTAPVSLYWTDASTVPSATTDIPSGALINSGSSYRMRIYCRADPMEKWLAFVTSVYSSPCYYLRLAADFSNPTYKDSSSIDYPGDGVAEAILREAFGKGCAFWLCNWEYDEPTVQVAIATPEHVEVQKVLWNDELVKAKDGVYKVPTTGELTITYHAIDGRIFADGTTEYTKSGITPAANIPASVCDKEVITVSSRSVSVDLAALQAAHVADVKLACGSDFTVATNGTVVTWTVPDGVAFTITYTAEEFHYYSGNARTSVVNYPEGVSADTTIDVAALDHPERAADEWTVVTEGTQKYLQNLGRAWKLYITESSGGYTIYRATDTTVTAVEMAPTDGVLDLTDVGDDLGKPVVGVGYGAFNDNHGTKNSWKITKFIAPKCTTLDTWAFNSCSALTDVEISPNATSIFNERTFSGCSSLTNFTPTVLPLVTSIGKASFENVPVGGDWVLAGVTEIKNMLFKGCANPNGFSVSLPNLTAITGNDASGFCQGSTITNFSAPKLASITAGCVFQDCKKLERVVLSEDITTIQYNAFVYCPKLAEIYPTTFRALTSMGGHVFDGATALKGHLEFPEMTSFSEQTFQNAGNLTSVSAPKVLLSGGNSVFKNCSSLTNAVVGGFSDGHKEYFLGCSALKDIYVTGLYAAPATKSANMFSSGSDGNADSPLVVVHVKAEDGDYSGWSSLCSVQKSELTVNHKKIANYATLPRSKLLGYVGGTISLDQKKEKIDKIYQDNGNLAWLVKWEDSGFSVIVR